jgi:hypothetical protein
MEKVLDPTLRRLSERVIDIDLDHLTVPGESTASGKIVISERGKRRTLSTIPRSGQCAGWSCRRRDRSIDASCQIPHISCCSTLELRFCYWWTRRLREAGSNLASGPAAVPCDEPFQMAVNVAYVQSERSEVLKDTNAKNEAGWVERKREEEGGEKQGQLYGASTLSFFPPPLLPSSFPLCTS